MRLTAGTARGKVLLAPRGNNTRPTDAQTREKLFNILGQSVVDAAVLDLYAGSGALGLEALSRGARKSTFVERDKGAAAMIRRNVAACEWKKQTKIWTCPAVVSLRKLYQQNTTFDIIMADPPFGNVGECKRLVAELDKVALLLGNSQEESSFEPLFVLQWPRHIDVPTGNLLELTEQRRAGESVLCFYQLPE